MRTGLLILAVFAAIWGSLALLGAGIAPGWVVAPIAISAALVAWTLTEPAAHAPSAPHVGRLVGIWSGVEGVGIFLAFAILPKLGRSDMIVPALAIIVGLHFLPLARGIPVRSYYAAGIALVLDGLIGMLLPAGERILAVGLTAAAILWGTAILRLIAAHRETAPAA